MVKYRPHILFTIIMIVYFLVRWYRPMSDSVFIKYYLTDLLFVPAMCLFALIFIRWIKRDNTLTIPTVYVLLQTIAVSFYFEWYLPKYFGRPGWYTSDFVDILMYVFGAGIYLISQRRIIQ